MIISKLTEPYIINNLKTNPLFVSQFQINDETHKNIGHNEKK